MWDRLRLVDDHTACCAGPTLVRRRTDIHLLKSSSTPWPGRPGSQIRIMLPIYSVILLQTKIDIEIINKFKIITNNACKIANEKH
jgi:hypothetical protein